MNPREILERDFGCRAYQAQELLDRHGWSTEDLIPWQAYLARLEAEGKIAAPRAYVYRVMTKQREAPPPEAPKPAEATTGKPVPPALTKAKELAKQRAYRIDRQGRRWEFLEHGLSCPEIRAMALYQQGKNDLLPGLADLCREAVVPEPERLISWAEFVQTFDWEAHWAELEARGVDCTWQRTMLPKWLDGKSLGETMDLGTVPF